MIGTYLLAWVGLAVAGVLNGIVREGTYGRRMRELHAHQLSTVVIIVITGAVVAILDHAWPIGSAAQAWSIGICWVVATVAFEFGFGRVVGGHTWRRLMADYNVLEGRLWGVFLVWLLCVPLLVYWLGQITR